MKITPLPLLVAGAGLAAAVPMRLVVVERVGSAVGRVDRAGAHSFTQPLDSETAPLDDEAAFSEILEHLGHTIEATGPSKSPLSPCIRPPESAEESWMHKWHEISNYFREIFGFAPVEDMEHFLAPMPGQSSEAFDAKIRCIQRFQRPSAPIPGGSNNRRPLSIALASEASAEELDEGVHILSFKPLDTVTDYKAGDHHHHPAGEFGPGHRGKMWEHRRRPHGFFGRMRHALYSLSPWEGRALSFVIGCGLGVLLRMFYVLIVIAYRSICAAHAARVKAAAAREQSRPNPAPAAPVALPAEAQSSMQIPPPEYEFDEKQEEDR